MWNWVFQDNIESRESISGDNEHMRFIDSINIPYFASMNTRQMPQLSRMYSGYFVQDLFSSVRRSAGGWYYCNMNWSGKLIGGVIGLVLGRWVGGLLGFFLGHLFDNWASQAAQSQGKVRNFRAGVGNSSQIAEQFFRITFEVMGHVAKADGIISTEEISAARTVMQDFRLNKIQVAAAISSFTLGKSPNYDFSRAVMTLRRSCAGRPDLLVVFLEIQLRAAISGADLRSAQRVLITRIAAILGVTGLELDRLERVLRLRQGSKGRSDYGGGGAAPLVAKQLSVTEAYQVLGVLPSAENAVLTKAYRRQLSRHHPDKLKANGLPESMLEHAKERTQQIIEAWDVISAVRGIKS